MILHRVGFVLCNINFTELLSNIYLMAFTKNIGTGM